ncbi:hypothetical protein E2F46_09810 [Luteimonas aestuarii]|uniref:Protein Atu4866 n=1 Tax=Luteimonas aestuarii TaxID=453837 RepID=A0A4R5TP50_9GAMM|nr:Atu4866 domain-containing protein [Luteimonas aestuarii]TDK23816.1 hypothetical protein E2F46_09810 [Luteimonas aestuarii]
MPDSIRHHALGATLATALLACSAGDAVEPTGAPARPDADHPYVGMWVTADGHVRHELLPPDRNGVGRYDEARGSRASAYQGRYTVTGRHIDYVDDTGFTADGTFIDDVLHHGGMVLRRETPSRNAAGGDR